MVPLDDHHEQRLNALDAERAGVALGHATFDLDALSRLPERADTEWFRAWCLEADVWLLDVVDRIAGIAAARRGQPAIAA
jgi:hypothetical protein